MIFRTSFGFFRKDTAMNISYNGQTFEINNDEEMTEIIFKVLDQAKSDVEKREGPWAPKPKDQE